MDKIELLETTNGNGENVIYVLIDRGNEEYTSMLKSEYDRRQAEQSTPSVTNGD